MMGCPPAAGRRLAAAAALLCLLVASSASAAEHKALLQAAKGDELQGRRHHRHAYAAMMYMGTPRDYEFYVAVRVMMRSLARVGADADRVLIASDDVPRDWVRAM